MKKILLVLLAAAGAVLARKKIDEGKHRAGPVGRGHRQRRQGLIRAPSVPGALAQLVAHLLCKQGLGVRVP